jgi:Na+/citrate or Na+/malate symporter
MENKYFLLEPKENPRAVKIFQISLGVICIAIAIFWIVFNIKSLEADRTLWATIVFLVLFGIYEILAGLGKTARYIKTGPAVIIIKQHSVLPYVELISSEIERIELYPLSIKFLLKNRKKFLFRFGFSYPEIISPVKDEIVEFARSNKIPLEVINE